jgi:hypothetical protein
MKNRNILLWACALGIALYIGGCGNAQREATEAAVNAAQTAINAAQGAAEKFVPEQTKAAQEALQTAKDAVAKGDYPAALSSAKDAAQKAKDAVAAATAKKQEWTNTWQSLNASAPKSMSEIQAKVDAYKKYGRYPKGVDKEHMDTAVARFDQLKQGWADATAAYKNGNLADAMEKAFSFKEGLQKLKELLGMQS